MIRQQIVVFDLQGDETWFPLDFLKLISTENASLFWIAMALERERRDNTDLLLVRPKSKSREVVGGGSEE